MVSMSNRAFVKRAVLGALPPLIGGRVHDQAVERFRHLDLAGQPRGRLHLEGEVEHVLFLG